MSMSLGDRCAKSWGDMLCGLSRGGRVSAALVAVWFIYPTAVATALHPGDAIALEYWLQGQPVPSAFSSQMLFAGELTALVALATLSLLLLVLVTVIYRRAGGFFSLWPVAGLATGIVTNGIWWLMTGFDFQGVLIGLMPLVAMVVCQRICEKLGADFVFGEGNRPPLNRDPAPFDPWGEYRDAK